MISAVNARIGEKIRKIRELKGLKQENVAQELGMSLGGYGKIERGESSISVDRLQQIAKVLDLADGMDIMKFDEQVVFNIQHNQSPSINGVVNNYSVSDTERASYEMRIQELKQVNQQLEKVIENQSKMIDLLQSKI
jgi:transcriptional regulator with XRE-family HTH domain